MSSYCTQAVFSNTAYNDALVGSTLYCRAWLEALASVPRNQTAAACAAGNMTQYVAYSRQSTVELAMLQSTFVATLPAFAYSTALSAESLFNATLWELGFFSLPSSSVADLVDCNRGAIALVIGLFATLVVVTSFAVCAMLSTERAYGRYEGVTSS